MSIIESKPKIIRLSTVGITQYVLLREQLEFLSNYFDIVVICSEDSYSKKLSREYPMIKVIELKMKREISVINDLFSLFNLIKVIKKEKPSIIHTNTPKSSLLSIVAGYIVKVPIRIYNVTGLRFVSEKGIKKTILKYIEKITCKLCTHIVAEGKGVKLKLYNEIIKKQATIIANGSMVGVDSYGLYNPNKISNEMQSNARNAINYSTGDFIFIAIGRIVKDKGIEELLYSFQSISSKNTNCKLVLLGSFEDNLDPISKEARGILQNNGKIIHIPWTDNVGGFLKISNVLIHASHREGFSNVILQAASMECPIICSDIPGNNDIINSNLGSLFPRGDYKALQKLMVKHIIKYEKYKIRAKRTRKVITRLFDKNTINKSLLKYYYSLLNKV